MTRFDALIVGGGIQGATMALEVARRGLHALLVEKEGTFGSGVTRQSLGIVHGGLRYLQRFDIPRFLRSRREQAWFLRELPELVRPLTCVMPLYRGSARSPALFRVAFLAARVLPPDGYALCGTLLDPAYTAPGFPLERAGLVAGARWREAVLDEPMGVAASIVQRSGAACLPRTEALELMQHAGRVTGIRALSEGGSAPVELRAPVVILCAGPASRALARRFDRDFTRLSSATLAFNLVLDAPRPCETALAVSAIPGRGRSLFLRDFQGGLLAGTWYVPSRDGARAAVPDEHLDSALAELRQCLPTVDCSRERVRAVCAGLLPDTDGTGRVLRTRDVVVDHGRTHGPQGLFTVLGTKLTTARALSEHVAARIWPRAGTDGRKSAGTQVASSG